MTARPFKLQSPRQLEDELHEQVAKALDRLLAPPARWTTVNMGHVNLPPAVRAKLQRLGAKAGWPDVFIIHGLAYGIELKAHGGTLTKTRMVRSKTGRLRITQGQEDEFPLLRAAGMEIAACESVNEVLAQIKLWKIPLRISAGSELTEAAST